MASQLQLPNQPPTRGLPIWTVLVALLLLAVVVIGGLGFMVYYQRSDKLKLQRQVEALEAQKQRADVEKAKATEDARLALARNLQEQVFAQVRAATNALTKLLLETDLARRDTVALRTNETGRSVALHPDLVPLARRFFEANAREIPPEEEIVLRLESVRRVEQQLLANRGTAYEPAADLGVTVQNANAWAEQGQLKVGQVRQALTSLAQEAKIKFTKATLTPESPTLEAAIARLNEQEAGSRLRQGDQTVSVARTDAETERAKAEAEKIRADATREADEVRAKIKEEQAAAERDRQEREAKLKLEESKTKVAVQAKTNEAHKVELRQKASTPDVRSKLAPFITPGHAQIGGVSPDKLPHSLSKLQSVGALDATMRGMAALVEVAISTADRDRPRWTLSRKFWSNHSADIEKVKEAQQLLNELGPVLVEMGLLQP